MRLWVCVCVGYMRLLLSVVFFVVFNPIGDSFIEPLFPIVSNDSFNFYLIFLVPYDEGRGSLDILDTPFTIGDIEPFGYVGIVYDSQWKCVRIFCFTICGKNFLVKFDTVYAITNGKHQ